MKKELGYYKNYHTESNLRQNIRSEFFNEKFRTECLPRMHRQMATLTVIHGIAQTRYVKTAKTLTMAKTAYTKYYSDLADNTDKTKICFLT